MPKTNSPVSGSQKTICFPHRQHHSSGLQTGVKAINLGWQNTWITVLWISQETIISDVASLIICLLRHRATLPDSDTSPWIWRHDVLSNMETKLAEKGWSQGSVIAIKKPQSPRVTMFLLESYLCWYVYASQGPAPVSLILCLSLNPIPEQWSVLCLVTCPHLHAANPASTWTLSQTFPDSETSPCLLAITTLLSFVIILFLFVCFLIILPPRNSKQLSFISVPVLELCTVYEIFYAAMCIHNLFILVAVRLFIS